MFEFRTPSSDSAGSSQLPCLGVFAVRSARPAAIGLGRDDPALSAMGLKNVFLSGGPDRAVAGALDNVEFQSSTTLVSNNRRVQRAPWAAWNKPRQLIWLPSLAVKNL